jgi:hypothetical protein
MNILLEQGVLGIVTGIITTAIIFLIKNLWTTKALPLLTATRYQGVLIGGQWQGDYNNTDPSNGPVFSTSTKLFLDQKAHQLSGLYLFDFKSHDRDFSLEFNVSGYIWEGYLTLNFTPKDRRITSYGTTLLKLHNGGNLLLGTWIYRNVEEERVDSSPLSLARELPVVNHAKKPPAT